MLKKYQKYLIDDTIIGINHSGPFTMIEDTPIFEDVDKLGIMLDYRYDNPSGVYKIDWFNKNNPTLTIKERSLRDLKFRKKALELRYPIPYAQRYIQYLKMYSDDFVLVSD